jgi:hypothetical protein
VAARVVAEQGQAADVDHAGNDVQLLVQEHDANIEAPALDDAPTRPPAGGANAASGAVTASRAASRQPLARDVAVDIGL